MQNSSSAPVICDEKLQMKWIGLDSNCDLIVNCLEGKFLLAAANGVVPSLSATLLDVFTVAYRKRF
ncbi:hypothetical protein BpHYR1_021222 [Brachionus plicatilis]|uniref:Uncharacterized protein n=1 Tax=Brachionus plicatilis TaxID=10195 RepID=A0A3M7T2U3_BRAPC|nr:hypothetical protein BpHYR1_021222 [Brachionus plicatilis]